MADFQRQTPRFVAVIKQSYSRSLARVHQAAISLQERRSYVGTSSYADKICRAFKHIRIFFIFAAGVFTAMLSTRPPACIKMGACVPS